MSGPSKRNPRNALLSNMFGMLAVVVAGLVVLAGTTRATQNPPRSGIGSGGNVAAQSATHRVSGTIGQIASSRPQSATHAVAEGIWNTFQICDCPFVGDLDTNSIIDIFDVTAVINVAFRGASFPASDRFCPMVSRADLTCDSLVDIFDVVAVVNTAFRGEESRCNPCVQ